MERFENLRRPSFRRACRDCVVSFAEGRKRMENPEMRPGRKTVEDVKQSTVDNQSRQ